MIKSFIEKCIYLFICLCIYQQSIAQIYEDKFGAGNTAGVKISTSSSQGDNEGNHTLNGTGYFPDLAGASRFLGQATLGATYEEIEYVTQIGVDKWIEEQMAMPHLSYFEKFELLATEVNQFIQTVHPGEVMDNPGELSGFVFWNAALKDPDVLRNKAAYALIQLLVTSRASIILNDAAKGHMSYYDILYKGAFGNYRDMLDGITHHLMMGAYLSHFQNIKGDPSLGTLPDENYAREIMQLFTIGLHELNIDGSYKLDADGNKIPTYSIADVQELAKVFTGLSGGAYDLDRFPQLAGVPLTFDRALNRYDMTVPMIMYQEYHDESTKELVDGTIIPAGQPGEQDIQMAIDALFYHPNVGPFVARRLIQQLVKSNPTPAYIKRVALAFNDNGKGTRGDMAAVFKAILLDPEARNCSWLDDARNGRMKQPMERSANLFRAFNINSPSGRVWFDDGRLMLESLGQAYMAAPSVFNFFTPFYAEDEHVEPNNMVSPEFQILHAVTSINYFNSVEDGIKDRPFRNRTRVNNNNPRLAYNNADDPFLDFSDELTELQNNGLTGLMDRLDILLCHGSLGDGARTIILSALQELQDSGQADEIDIIHNALYFILVSPDYVILE